MVSARVKEPAEIYENWWKDRCWMYFGDGKKMENINEGIRLALGIGVLEKMASARMKEPQEINENLWKDRCLMCFMNEKKNREY